MSLLGSAPRRRRLAGVVLLVALVGCGDGEGTDADDTDVVDDTDGTTLACGDHASPVDGACVCDDGWEGDGRTCTDVDECATDAPCVDVALSDCVNTEGGFTCACVAGYHDEGGACLPDWVEAATYSLPVPSVTAMTPRLTVVGDRVFLVQEDRDDPPRVLMIDPVAGTVSDEVAPSADFNPFDDAGYTPCMVGSGASVFVFEAGALRYDTGARAWSTVPHPEEFWHGEAAAVELGGSLYLIGGRGFTDGTRVDRFDPAQDAWASSTSLPLATDWGAAAVLGGRIHVAMRDPAMGGHVLLFSWAPGEAAWTALASVEADVPRPMLVAAGDELWMGGGRSLWRYDPALDVWSEPLRGMDFDAMTSVGGEVYVVQGNRSGTGKFLRYEGP